MPSVSIERISDWLYKNRTEESYAFKAYDIAIGVGGLPGEVYLLCENAANTGKLGSVYKDNVRYYTHISIGFDIGKKNLKELESQSKITKINDHFEWLPQKKKSNENR